MRKRIKMYCVAILTIAIGMSQAACGVNEVAKNVGSSANAVAGNEDSSVGTDAGNEGDNSANAADEGSSDVSDADAAEECLLVYTSQKFSSSVSNGYEYEYEYVMGTNGLAQKKYCVMTVTMSGSEDRSMVLSVFEYDENGRMVLETQYSSGESDTITYEYDEAGNQVLQAADAYETISEYDDNGNLTRQEYCYYSGTTFIYTYEYDQNAEMIKYTVYIGDEWMSSSGYERDEDSRITAMVEYDEDGNVTTRAEAEYTYDDSGNIKLIEYSVDGVIYASEEYDEYGNMICQTGYDDSGEVSMIYENEYILSEEYFSNADDEEYATCEELVDQLATAIFELDGAKVLDMMYDGIENALRVATLRSRDDLEEALSEALEDEIDKACADFDWEDGEISWTITKRNACPEETLEEIRDEVGEYPSFEDDNVWELEVQLTVTTSSGTGEFSYGVYLIEDENGWHLLMLS